MPLPDLSSPREQVRQPRRCPFVEATGFELDPERLQDVALCEFLEAVYDEPGATTSPDGWSPPTRTLASSGGQEPHRF